MKQERQQSDQSRFYIILKTAAHLSFALFFFLVLTTPSWRYGPFSWLPLARFELLAGGPVQFGLLNLLPALTILCWSGYRFIERQHSPENPRPFQWGNKHTTLPLLGLTLVGLISLAAAPARIQFIQAGGLMLAWFVYLFVLNERPNRYPILAAVILVEGIVAIAQFWHQGDLGLTWLGELPLDPIYQGVSVIFARERPWLRAYGLTAHPNLLGAILTALLLLLLPITVRSKSWRRTLWFVLFLLGWTALLLTFSRGANLAFFSGFVVWLWLREKSKKGEPRQKIELRPLIRNNLKFLLPLLLLIPLLFFYSDLFMSRLTHLDAPSEAQSINQRQTDARLAVELIAENPFTGVGLGRYTDVARTINPQAARVHNVPLFVTAELGLPGLLLLLWLLLAPFARKPLKAAAIVPWIAMIIIGLFDTTLWLTSNWQTAVLFGLLAANLSPDNPE